MPYSPGKKGRDDLYICPECGGYLDEDGICLDLLSQMFEEDTLMGTVRVTTTCEDCGAELVAYIEARLQTDNEVFSLESEDDEPKDNQSNSYRHCGNCYQSWSCNCDDPVSICNICDGDQNDCQCGGYS